VVVLVHLYKDGEEEAHSIQAVNTVITEGDNIHVKYIFINKKPEDKILTV
jgi:hypothetical protein